MTFLVEETEITSRWVWKKCEITRAELTDILRKAGVPIPDRARVSVQDPRLVHGWDDPPPDEPLEISWRDWG